MAQPRNDKTAPSPESLKSVSKVEMRAVRQEKAKRKGGRKRTKDEIMESWWRYKMLRDRDKEKPEDAKDARRGAGSTSTVRSRPSNCQRGASFRWSGPRELGGIRRPIPVSHE